MALDSTVRELAPGLLRFCLGSGVDRASAEDVAQESLAALVQRWRRHGPPDNPEAFVFTVARRRLLRARVKRRLLAPLGVLGDPPAPIPSDLGLEARERLRLVIEALARLTGCERQALLISLDGLSTGQAARCLGVGLSAYKMRLHRARSRLRTLLEEHDEDSAR